MSPFPSILPITETAMLKKETSSWYLFSVRIIQARHIPCKDLLSHSDCYVSLWLPTASHEKVRTKTISNNSNPLWNESFHFRIQTQVKNILEMELYDEDVVAKDDLFTVACDVAKVKPGETVHEQLTFNSEGKEVLEVEFMMGSIPSPPEKLITNGVLVAREMLCLEVQMTKGENEEPLKRGESVMLMVKESYEEMQRITEDSDILCLHCIKGWEPTLKATLESGAAETKMQRDASSGSLEVPLNSFSIGQKMKVALPLEKPAHLELQLKASGCLEGLDVRLGFDLCVEEQDFLRKRKKVVAEALKKCLYLEQDLQEHEVPLIVIMATGGGYRAMSSLYGHLLGFQKMNLLDCVTYLTGTSGSTWAISNLYEDANWSHKDLVGPISKAQKHITKSKASASSWKTLKRYIKELRQRAQEGHLISFTDMLALILEHMLHGELNNSTLSNQRQAVNQGQNPLPFYLALNVKKDMQSSFAFKEWCEFSPFEVGFLKYGAFIRSEDFGSHFFMGRLMNRIPESRICYLEAVWSNIFSANLLDVWNVVISLYPEWKEEDEKNKSLSTQPFSAQKTVCFSPPDEISHIVNKILTSRPAEERTPNFLKGLQFHKDYDQHEEFSTWNDVQVDVPPNHLTPLEEELCLVDAAYFINTSCPPLLRKERRVDVILYFGYSLLEPCFDSIEETGQYCVEQGLPFPKIVLTEEDKKNPKECYVFVDDENPEVPIVLFFPLVNNTFKEYKAPGVKCSPAEMEKDDIDFVSSMSPYKLENLTYSKDDFDKLLMVTEYNVQNNKDLMLQAFYKAVERRKHQQS
ncbi:PREDICTED: cytosolic phospholipase A2 delta-like isoform X2 [Crocodylus porosus]|uniref:cytosolic phospholipase A2 delta-like isoform X2 n=1 Tax=Crocodylus porosus TaxID=8502 RepID=UPI00093E86EC|nr:PREDICTED: cytosolic phospholipase A2 delta-like isoform X2 [Crocodylus porosus]